MIKKKKRMTQETYVKSNLLVTSALRKYDQCTPQMASSTTDSRAPNFFHISIAARVKASTLRITAKNAKAGKPLGKEKPFL